jgi:Zn-dependent peptidase ImmA (M78 family)/DNA-binding XRE family transcriptional regulator
MIFGERVKQARELKGLTQKQLADAIGVNQSTIAHIETERICPSTDLINAIASETDVQPAFFEREPIKDFSPGSLVYRARANSRASERAQAYQYSKLYIEQIHGMAAQLTLPPLQLPKSVDSPVKAARLARVTFGADPTSPIQHVINILERHGVIIFSLPFGLERIDAYSTWATIDRDRPIITLSAGRPGDRVRSSVAHELGHLVMHQGLHGRVPELESEANQFAAEFLLPEEAMKQTLSHDLTLTNAARLKVRWRVSMQMLIRRAHDLGIITDRRYRYLFEQIGRKGWRKIEPVEIPIERPRIYKKMAEILYNPLEEADGLASATNIKYALSATLLAQYDHALAYTDLTDTDPYLYTEGREYKN